MPPSPRFLPLDVFRGLTVCFMIIVNTPGNSATTFPPLLHAKWHGFTPTDLVFPSFLFAVGNAMAFVLPKWEGMATSQVLGKILRRTFIIFLLGFLMYWLPFLKWEGQSVVAFPFAETRVFGVLQRIALCYGLAAVMLWFLKPRMSYILSALFLLLYWGLLYWLSGSQDPLSLEGNAVRVVDRWLIGEKHMYHGDGIAFDPEGLLSTLPAVANVTLGYWAGNLVRTKGKTWETLSLLLMAGVCLVFVAYCWDPLLPVNKKLWTGSFVVLTVGLDCIILALVMYIIDFRMYTGWANFFTVFGRNPLFIYLLSEVIAILLWFFKTSDGVPYYTRLYETIFGPIGGYAGSFLFACTVMLSCWMVGLYMDKKKWYIRV